MVRDKMILMWANPFRGPLEGVGPENRDFLGPENAKDMPSVIKKINIVQLTSACSTCQREKV